MSLTTQTDSPQLVVSIGSGSYSFSELPITQLGRLQAWIQAHHPHPLEAIKGHLDGFSPADRAVLLENARIEARSWPPEIGTVAGDAALLETEPGQIEALVAGLSVHHPDLARADVERLYRMLRKDAGREARKARLEGREYDGDGDVRRIFGVLFRVGTGDDDVPKLNGRSGMNSGT